MNKFSFLVDGVQTIAANPKILIMWVVGALLIWLTIEEDFEPALLLPVGFDAILINLPLPGVLGSTVVDAAGHATVEETPGIVTWLFQAGIKTSEVFPLLLLVGIDAMIGFGPLLSSPRVLLFGDAAQLGIFLTVVLAVLLGLPLRDAINIDVIGAADGPTSILASQTLGSTYVGTIAVTAYSYMALVPVIQPLTIRLVTSKRERVIRMPYNPKSAIKTTKILFPIIVTLIASIIAPDSIAPVGLLVFGNLIRESGHPEDLSQTAQGPLTNLITIFLGITIVFTTQADRFLNIGTLIVMALGLFAFVSGTIDEVLFVKVLSILLPQGKKINPMVGGAGTSAFPMSSRMTQKMALKEDNQDRLLTHAVGANVADQIDPVVVGGIVLSLVKVFLA